MLTGRTDVTDSLRDGQNPRSGVGAQSLQLGPNRLHKHVHAVDKSVLDFIPFFGICLVSPLYANRDTAGSLPLKRFPFQWRAKTFLNLLATSEKLCAGARELVGRAAELANCLIAHHLPTHATIEPGGRKASA